MTDMALAYISVLGTELRTETGYSFRAVHDRLRDSWSAVALTAPNHLKVGMRVQKPNGTWYHVTEVALPSSGMPVQLMRFTLEPPCSP